jgi:hypothetical protein
MLPDALIRHVKAGNLMQLGSVTDAGPRIFSVWYAATNDMSSIVFISNRTRNHSIEFARDPRVGGTIVAIELEGLGQKVEGVSFFGEANEATDSALAETYETYAERWPTVRGMFSVADVVANKTDMRVYTVGIRKWVFFSEREYPTAPRQEFDGSD